MRAVGGTAGTSWTMPAPHCDYCGRPARLTSGREVYPHRPDLAAKRFYACTPCDAYVGCHPGTVQPLGRLADAELRAAKQAAHAEFDKLWKQKLLPSRTAAYAWLAGALRIEPRLCHIGMMDPVDCRRTALVSAAYYQTLTNAGYPCE
jgi:hypothetical protein